jgi:hypothetical protein
MNARDRETEAKIKTYLKGIQITDRQNGRNKQENSSAAGLELLIYPMYA